ncbi:MAG: CRISPR-associated helicase Cas3' [Verrucomicrobiae bacterium]|nr:CRISPR-associated helicase Cas3' [Verrucomicrobiae bacterium]
MPKNEFHFWAKTYLNQEKQEAAGISVYGHCLNVGMVTQAFVLGLPVAVRKLLPGDGGQAAVLLAALHDIGKITLGFQVKCVTWLIPDALGENIRRRALDSVPDHALVSQVFLQDCLKAIKAQLWAAAVGAHHGRPKGRNAKLTKPEACPEWAEAHRKSVLQQLVEIFGPLPGQSPNPIFRQAHSDLWLLAGLISVADWIGSNEAFFPPDRSLPVDESRFRAVQALSAIGWPGGKLVSTPFARAFTGRDDPAFRPNAVQQAVAGAAPGLVIIEAPMGCGKTEAALHLAQHWIAAGHHHGIYFALPTQVTSNRIHLRVADFLHHTLENPACLRLAHANAWLEDDSNLALGPSRTQVVKDDNDNPFADLREARSWFASSKHSLLAPYGVGTIDQALQGMVTVKHFFVRRFALAGKVVVLDEIHSYDIYTGTLVGALVGELLNLGCSVIILSATLTAKRRQELLRSAGCIENDSPGAYPLVSCATRGQAVQHLRPEWSVKRRIALRVEALPEPAILDELIHRAEAGQHVLWIRNTVIEAQESFAALRGQIAEGDVRLGLLHSRFPFTRRQELEAQWLDRLGRHRAPTGPGSILIATQVVEQSVDIDLDFIVSDLAPTDMLIQRLGRLWRHDRPVGHRAADQPEFWVRLPELGGATQPGELKAALGRSARVYAPYVLLRTARVWRGRGEIHLPDDIRPMLEATYADPEAAEPPEWQDLLEELEKEKKTLELNAKAAMQVFGLPMLDPESDGALTRRKGAPTTPLLILRSVSQLPGGKGWLLTAPDGSTTIVSDFEWSLAAARFLHQWLVRVPRWHVPPEAPNPRWLGEHTSRDAVVAFLEDDGGLRFGDIAGPASYHPDFGVFADKPARSRPDPKPWSDDDEFDQ